MAIANPTLISAGRLVFSDLEKIIVAPWDDADTVGTVGYDIRAIVGDTTSIEQDDNDTNEIPWEFGDEPLLENITLGKWQFSTECIDFQNKVLKNIFGWEGGANETDAVFAPNSYKDVYATIELYFKNADKIIVLPKVKMNSKATLASLKTDAARATISGTGYSAFVKVGTQEAYETPFAIIPETQAASYTITAEKPAA